MRKLINKIRVGLLHAKYHRNLKSAETARKQQDIVKFKKYVYRAEDAWKQIVIITNKNK
jgi:hypothetical protein